MQKKTEVSKVERGTRAVGEDRWFFLPFAHLSQVSVKHFPNIRRSTPTPRKMGTFPLELTDTNTFIFINCPRVCISAFGGAQFCFLRRMSLQFIAGRSCVDNGHASYDVSAKTESNTRSDSGQEEEIWNTGGFFPFMSGVFFEKESRGVREWAGRRGDGSQADRASFDGGTSPFFVRGPLRLLSGASAREEAGLAFPCRAALASIRKTLCDEGYKISSQCLSPLRRLHGGGCQRKAKQIRSRNDAPVFPCCARSMGQICSCVCVYTRAPSRS